MSLFRTIVLLLAGLLMMLTIIVLRTETARVHYRVSHCDQRADVLRQELRDAELELQRLRNPAMIRAKASELRDAGLSLKPEPPRKSLPPAVNRPKKP